MPATSCWPDWTVQRAVAMLVVGDENIDPAFLARELECDLDEAMEVIDAALEMRPLGGCTLYDRREAH